jgi:hypothetical protein
MADNTIAESGGAIAPERAASEPPQSPVWRLGRYAVACGLAVSTIVHLGLVGTVLFVSPRLGYPEPVAAVPVDIVTLDEVAAASSPKPDPAAQPAAPETQTPTQTATQTPVQAPAETPTQTANQTPTPASPPLPEPSLPLDAFALPRPPVAAPKAPAPASTQVAQLAQLIGLPIAGLNGGSPSEVQAKLTGDEIAAFAAHLRGCWSAPSSLANAPTFSAVLRVSLRRDGRLASEPVLIAAPASTQGPALVQSAMRALVKCQPYGSLPAAKYDEWRVLDLHFSPGGLSTATPVSEAPRAPS